VFLAFVSWFSCNQGLFPLPWTSVMVVLPLLILCILLLLLMVGAGLTGGVVIHQPPGTTKIGIIQRRH